MILTCDFTDSFCTLVQSRTDDFNWARGSTTPSRGTGPSADHTTGTGTQILTILSLQFYILSISLNFARISGAFAYIEASGKPPGLYTDLDLPPLEESPVYCLRFWYNMNGPDIGQLQVVVDDGTGETIMFDETKQGGA